jgi:hypothetical protein
MLRWVCRRYDKMRAVARKKGYRIQVNKVDR